MDKFALKIACLCAIAFICPVLMATYVDSNIHHILFGPRYYKAGYWIILGGAFPSILAYIFNSSYSGKASLLNDGLAIRKGVLTLISLFVPMCLALWNFQPEFPHIAISVNYFIYSLIILLIVYVHNYNFAYLQSPLSNNAKLERIKLEHKKWRYSLGILMFAAFIFSLFMYSVFFVLPKQYTEVASEQFLIFNSFIIELFLGIIFAVLAFIEIYRRIAEIENEMFNIQRKIDIDRLYSIAGNGYLIPLEEGKEVIDRKFNELLDDLHEP